MYRPRQKRDQMTCMVSLIRNSNLRTKSNQLNHIILGDFNPNSWSGDRDNKFQEWLAETAMWSLSNPEIPTHAEGSALDGILFHPGAEILWELLPPECEMDASRTEDDVECEEGEIPYSAVTHPRPRIADHHLVMLRL